MSNYTKATNFATKDALTSGNPLKTLSGTELDDEFNAIQAASVTKANTASAQLTGIPVAPTAAADTSTAQLATTAFVTTEANLKADLASPTFTGVPAAPTAAADTSTTQLATTAFVTTEANLKADLAGAAFTGAITTTSTIDGVDIATRDGVLTTTTTTADAALPKAGGTLTGDVSHGDGVKSKYGNADDLQIYHSGTESIIAENGTGDLKISGNNLWLNDVSGNTYFRAVNGSYAKMYHAGVEKLATTSTGVDVTGTVTADGLVVASTGNITLDSGTGETHNITLSHKGSYAEMNSIEFAQASTTYGNNQIKFLNMNSTGSVVETMRISGGGDISFYEDTGTTPKFFWDASAESLGIGGASTFTSGTNIEVADANVARLGFTNTSTNGSQWAWFAGTSGQAGLYDYDNSRQAITVDSSGNVGIGTSSPAHALVVSDTYAPTLEINNSDVTIFTGETIGEIKFTGDDGGVSGVGASITAIAVNNWSTGDLPSHLLFKTNSGAANAEAMRISSTGDVLVGTTNTAVGAGNTSTGISLRGGSDNRSFFSVASNYVMSLNRNTSDGNILEFAKDGTNVGSIGAVAGATYYGGTTKALRINTTGFHPATNAGAYSDNTVDLGHSAGRFKNLYLSGGVYLGGTGAGNLLSEYEEGTWVPVLKFGGGVVGITYSNVFGKYTKIGNRVYFDIYISLSSAGTSTGSASITLPVVPADAWGTTGHEAAVSLGFATGLNTIRRAGIFSDKIVFFDQDTTASAGEAENEFDDNANFRVSGSYQAA